MVELKDCSKTYKNKSVFETINYTLKNDIYWLTGSNGIGKSVFCRCLVGLEKFSSGTVNGNLGNVLYLPDRSVADNWLTMMENINLIKYYFKLSLSQEKQQEIIDKLEIVDEDQLVSQVSVGTSLKVGLFLLFVERHWGTIILDETLSHVDNYVKGIVLSELEKRKQEGTCIIIIHHGELYTKGTEETAHKIILDKNGLTDVKEIDV